jgi:hypothetical protein
VVTRQQSKGIRIPPFGPEYAPLLGKVHKPLDFFSGFRIMVTRGEVYAEIGFYS